MLAFIFGGIGPSEMLVIGVVAVLLFGSKLPSVARSAGKSLTEFKRGMQDLQSEFSSAMSEADRAATTAAEGTQGRLPNDGDSYRDDSLGGEAYDDHYGDDYECESEIAAAEAEANPANDTGSEPADETAEKPQAEA